MLVVDDEPAIRALITDMLADLGYNAIEAGDGPAGLALLRAAAGGSSCWSPMSGCPRG